jgi:hypothetical protein
MTNIHIIPTDKLSRLHKAFDKAFDKVFILSVIPTIKNELYQSIPQNIYITSDEEIKEGDWCLSKLNEVVNFGKKFTASLYKKIILTTDIDLIKDGVQAIDDTFLEWFVKNPSCERVEVRKIGEEWIYNADVPKEEFKQKTIEDAAKIWVNNRFTKQICGNESYPDIHASKEGIVESHILFAKCQEERMYSEGDMKKAIRFGFDKGFCSNSSNKIKNLSLSEQEWFEQFKKK